MENWENLNKIGGFYQHNILIVILYLALQNVIIGEPSKEHLGCLYISF